MGEWAKAACMAGSVDPSLGQTTHDTNRSAVSAAQHGFLTGDRQHPRRTSPLKSLSVVIPCYNEADSLPEMLRRAAAVCGRVAGDDYEIVIVNDGSTDRTWQAIVELSQKYPMIVGIDLARNHGHQLALTAGFSMARGHRIFVVDADLQDPPELLPDMMAIIDAGADVAYGQRLQRAGETWFKRSTAALFYRVLQHLTDAPIPADTGDFRLMTRRVLEVILSMPEQHRFVRGMVAWVGFRQVAVPYQRQPRFAGATKYPLRKMIRFAADAITGFSIAPLRISLYLGLGSVLAAVALSAFTLWSWLARDAAIGWTSMAIFVLAFSGMQMFCLAIMGEYIGRIYIQAKQRPLFIIRSVYERPTT